MKSIENNHDVKFISIHRIMEVENSGYIKYDSELLLSNAGQLELLNGMRTLGVSIRTMVRGFSMYPFICDQDVLIISPLKDRQPRIGDIVAFSHPKTCRLVIHRIVKRINSGWLIRGDNCLNDDGLVRIDNILGYVISIERNGRKKTLGLGVLGGHIISTLSLYNMLSPTSKLAVLLNPMKKILKRL